MSSNCLVVHTSECISSSKRSLFDVYFLTYNSRDWFISNLREVSEEIVEMLFLQVYSILLAGSFQFSFGHALPSAHFHLLPCYPRLSIFNRVSNIIDLILYVFCLFF